MQRMALQREGLESLWENPAGALDNVFFAAMHTNEGSVFLENERKQKTNNNWCHQSSNTLLQTPKMPMPLHLWNPLSKTKKKNKKLSSSFLCFLFFCNLLFFIQILFSLIIFTLCHYSIFHSCLFSSFSSIFFVFLKQSSHFLLFLFLCYFIFFILLFTDQNTYTHK